MKENDCEAIRGPKEYLHSNHPFGDSFVNSNAPNGVNVSSAVKLFFDSQRLRRSCPPDMIVLDIHVCLELRTSNLDAGVGV